MGYLDKEIVVFGCGNILFGDDGFGPEAVEHLQKNYDIPSNVYVVSAGLGVRKFLFDILLSESKPRKIIIVDAVDLDKPAGSTFHLEVDQMPEIKCDDFSMHQVPTSNLLKELKKFSNVEVKIIATQVQTIPGEVSPGLSEAIRNSIPVACDMIISEIKRIENLELRKIQLSTLNSQL